MNRLVMEIGTAFEAIEARKQRIAMFVTTFSEMRDHRSWFNAIAEAALAKGWIVTLFHDAGAKLGSAVRVFIGRDEDIWRVPALIAARETGFVEGRWTRNAEARQNALLGVSTAEIVRRDAARARPELVYVVLDRAQLARARAYGFRSFGTPAETAGLTLLRAAPARLRKNSALARVSVRSVAAVLGRMPARTLTVAQVAKLYGAMFDRIEVKTRRGWR